MSVLGLISKDNTGNYTESTGYYNRVPIRVGEFTVTENSHDQIVFETTSQDFCDDGPKLTLTIAMTGTGWAVNAKQGAYHWTIAPAVDLHDDDIARKRAMWHAAQYMSGNTLSHQERYTITHTTHTDNHDVFEDDAFFTNGEPITTDPFNAFLE